MPSPLPAALTAFWEHLKFLFLLPQTGLIPHFLFVCLRCHLFNGIYDDSLIQIPVPASLALAALSGAFLSLTVLFNL